MALNNSINLNPDNPLNAETGGSGLNSPTANGILQANGASPYSSRLLTNGQLLIGSTGAQPSAATISAGAGISVTNGAGSITVAYAPPWTEVTGTSQSGAVNSGYTANNAGLVSISLPTTSAVGDFIEVNGKGAGGWKVTQAAGQQILFGAASSTSGATGYLASTLQYDCVRLRALAADGNSWVVVSSVGTLDVV